MGLSDAQAAIQHQRITYERQYAHLQRILQIIGWHRALVQPSECVVRFEKTDGGPDDWADLPRSMEPLEMAETLTRVALLQAQGVA